MQCEVKSMGLVVGIQQQQQRSMYLVVQPGHTRLRDDACVDNKHIDVLTGLLTVSVMAMAVLGCWAPLFLLLSKHLSLQLEADA